MNVIRTLRHVALLSLWLAGVVTPPTAQADDGQASAVSSSPAAGKAFDKKSRKARPKAKKPRKSRPKLSKRAKAPVTTGRAATR